MKEALLLAVGRLVCTTPWYVICCVPFYAHRRISRSKIAAVITGISMLFLFVISIFSFVMTTLRLMEVLFFVRFILF